MRLSSNVLPLFPSNNKKISCLELYAVYVNMIDLWTSAFTAHDDDSNFSPTYIQCQMVIWHQAFCPPDIRMTHSCLNMLGS